MKFHQYWGYWFSMDHVSQYSEITYVGSGERLLFIEGLLLPQVIYSMVSLQNLCFLWIPVYLLHSSWRYQLVANILQMPPHMHAYWRVIPQRSSYAFTGSCIVVYSHSRQKASFRGWSHSAFCLPGPVPWHGLIFSWTKYSLIKLYVLGRICPYEYPSTGCRYRPAAFDCLEALLPSI